MKFTLATLLIACLLLSDSVRAQISYMDINWVRSITGNWGDYDTQNSNMQADAQGNVYLSALYGELFPFDPSTSADDLSSFGHHLYIAKIDDAGNYLWNKSIEASDDLRSAGLTLDEDMNIFIAGTFSGTMDADPGAGIANLTSDSISDLFIAKYDMDGNYLWSMSPYFRSGTVKYILCDADNNIYVAGTFRTTTDFDPGAGEALRTPVGFENTFLVKYDTDGNFLWVITLDCISNPFPEVLYTDDENNIFLAGENRGPADFDPGAAEVILGNDSPFDYIYFAKYSPAGEFLLAKRLEVEYPTCRVNSIATDASGGIFITGAYGSFIDMDPDTASEHLLTTSAVTAIFIAGYNADGSFRWAHSFGDTWLNQDFGQSIFVDGDKVVVMGQFDEAIDFDPGIGEQMLGISSGLNSDIFFGMYTTEAGDYVWAAELIDMDMQYAYSMIKGPGGDYYVQVQANTDGDFDLGADTLTAEYFDEWTNVYVARYKYNDEHLTGIKTINMQPDIAIYPNPAADKFTVQTDKSFENASLSIIDITGRVIYTAESLKGNVFTLNIPAYPAGTYMVRLQDGYMLYTEALQIQNSNK